MCTILVITHTLTYFNGCVLWKWVISLKMNCDKTIFASKCYTIDCVSHGAIVPWCLLAATHWIISTILRDNEREWNKNCGKITRNPFAKQFLFLYGIFMLWAGLRRDSQARPRKRYATRTTKKKKKYIYSGRNAILLFMMLPIESRNAWWQFFSNQKCWQKAANHVNSLEYQFKCIHCALAMYFFS